ncbi:cysteine synthase A [Mumia flava]|uniref:L-cysteine desulfhydrase Cds1 n=1 Tax=Mumia flava TaxID=1348852 RepID=A0A0B2BQ31_9ACTN|nr:PLP-dependent cysteine synthase family protein [Mumia flava]PJJ58187.1 cysteine synthase A [Mumia flava]
MPRTSTEARRWIDTAIGTVQADANRSADTHLHVFPLPGPDDVALYLKDESVHPTGSLKHRLARSLFLYALSNGWVGPDTTIIEASSGSTAVSEAYFARLLGLDFVAVMPRSTSPRKIALIEWYGGRCHFVDEPPQMYAEAARLAEECGGHYLDQFTFAERATDWRGNNNIAESIFEQLAAEPYPCPSWIVVSAGTGGTSATIGRYVRYRRYETRLLVVDPENSAFLDGWELDTSDYTTGMPSRIEGIGRPRVEPSFVGGVIDDMVRVPDAASIAAMRWTTRLLGRPVGGSTGTNMWGALHVVQQMRDAGERGSVVTLLADGGDRYTGTYYDDGWVADQGLDLAPYESALAAFESTGAFRP